nr:PREDICTED: integrin alpha-10 isoform X1 [Latimeria chalumnae]|eukprot:XP_014341411.1 PREDICTED: integrin alpha-10 isoform X1 [Latimeria chalumnae]
MECCKRHFILCMVLAFEGLSDSFNIDVKRPRIFQGPKGAQFGYKVLPYEAEGQKWLLVGAPWDGTEDNRMGDVYKCTMGEETDSTCTKLNIGDSVLQNVSKQMKNTHFGMTLEDNKGDSFVACAPLWSQECGTSVFSTGICMALNETFQSKEIIAPTAQRCTTYMDIVIVLDGSNSIYPWYEVKNFLRNILSKFFIGPDQIQVGVLQYGEVAVHEWSLKDYQTVKEVLAAAKNISRQKGQETRTAYAINMACTEAFSPERGAREGATKLMIVVTDGESHDGEELPQALAECEKRNVTRYAIAVLGHYIRRQQNPDSFINEIKYIASDPDEKYFFNVTDEAALNDIVDALGDRIFSLEGVPGYNTTSFELEMSQIGFSTHILEDGILFGTVGAYDWDGAVLKESKSGRVMPSRAAFEKEFPIQLKNHAAYLGYTVSSVRLRNRKLLYVAGAPRYRHKGKVILFDMTNDGNVTISQALTGEQIGSYFGSEVCPVDVDGDGFTDVLLVAAPMYLGSGNRETGRVHVYKIKRALFSSSGTLQTHKKSQDSRFGYSLAAIPDLNHDGFSDVAVGAPLEDNHRGAVYIYHGYQTTILPAYKQRISASGMNPTLRYFGRSVTGQMDLDGDGLMDLSVGAEGQAVMLSSRSIVQINVSVEFVPSSINVIQKNCQRGGKDSACVLSSVCFNVASHSPGVENSTVEILYNTTLDERKFTSRAIFDDNFQKHAQRVLEARVGKTTCSTLRFHVTDTADYLRPIAFSLQFRLNDSRGSSMLDQGYPTSTKKLIPFFKGCGEDDECVTDLLLQAKMDISGSRQNPYVIRSIKKRVLIEVTLENKKENAYNTSLRLFFSRNLLFASLAIKGDPQSKIECTALSSNTKICFVNYPVFRSLAKVTFTLEFEFSCSLLLNRVQVKLTANSDSTELDETRHDNSVHLFAVIRYEPELFISSESHLNRYEVHPSRAFTEGFGPEFKTSFKVQNLGCFPVSNLSVAVHLPAMAYGNSYFLSVSGILADNDSVVSCVLQNTTDMVRRNQSGVIPVHYEDLLHAERLNCSNSWCEVINCHLHKLEKNQEVAIGILRTLHDDFFRKAKFRSVRIISRLILGVKEPNLLLLGEATQHRESALEVIKPKLIPISLWILIGSIIGGLLLLALIIFILWKFGFFSRKTPEEERKEE